MSEFEAKVANFDRNMLGPPRITGAYASLINQEMQPDTPEDIEEQMKATLGQARSYSVTLNQPAATLSQLKPIQQDSTQSSPKAAAGVNNTAVIGEHLVTNSPMQMEKLLETYSTDYVDHHSLLKPVYLTKHSQNMMSPSEQASLSFLGGQNV